MSTVPPTAESAPTGRLTHVDEHGKAHMVDVTGKSATRRIAEARCSVRTVADVARLLADRTGGFDLLESAQFAGIMAAKRTSVLIPLCHPIRLDGIDVGIRVAAQGFEVMVVATVIDKTGVEMEALTACTTAGLVLLRALFEEDPLASIDDLTLWHKSGGRTGIWERPANRERPVGPDERTSQKTKL
jgi:cyclic pyranopterin monophosphate synthase